MNPDQTAPSVIVKSGSILMEIGFKVHQQMTRLTTFVVNGGKKKTELSL